ncbi:MAG: ARMT1-like domain-containing protein [Nitrososphaeria archaeon]
METSPECVLCYIGQMLRSAQIVTNDKKILSEILKSSMRELADLDWDYSIHECFSKIYQAIPRFTGIEDPYLKAKEMHNKKAFQLYPSLLRIIKQSRTPLMTSIRFSIAGNIIDLGALNNVDVNQVIGIAKRGGFKVNDVSILKKMLNKSEKVILVADNSGEIVFDLLLLKVLSEMMNNPKISMIVKKKPILNDVIITDVPKRFFKELKNLELDAIDISSSHEVQQFKEYLNSKVEKGDLIISKGQGNFELLDDIKGVFFLLIVKCPVVARYLNSNVGDFILKYNQ